ncbi:MAG: hemolysin secretion protein D [Methylobacter sp.]|nr:MAG: hemolysin secretion protein D [Methylobacter sp.]PPD04393.1 MAG: hemolysin secretion protein D [Methylobacter sp.]PPD18986.1 MAG: hemolysin secretion protein D [Methylobacter sp.]PPD37447.1 MAG: hemolysin secretion protein D [Methylomonas sp.]
MLNAIRNYWVRQRQLAKDQTYINAVNHAGLLSVSPGSHLILWFSLAFVLSAIVWAGFATLDEVTRGTGKIVPSSHVQVIQNLEGGILSEIYVKEGDLVEKDQALMQLDDVRFASSFNETQLKYYELLANSARLTAESEGSALKIPDEVLLKYPSFAEHTKNLYASRAADQEANAKILQQQMVQKEQELVELKSKQEQIAKSYDLLKRELDISEPLVAQGAMSEVEMLRLKRNANDLNGELNAARLAIPRVQAALNEAKSKLSEQKIHFQSEAGKELNETKSELDRTAASVMALKDRVTRTRITSPVKGTVKQIKITTLGGVVQPGMDLMEIVPVEDQLLVQAEIRPADIAFLRPGQAAMVKLTAYDFSIYGGLEARLEHISADTITNEEDKKNYYQILLRTNSSYLEKNGEKLNIITGMNADVDILTGKKTVLDYLLKPILKAKARALRER